MKTNPLILAIGALLILLVCLLLFVFQVRKSEVVVVTTFGKATRDIVEPGPHLKWPWPIESVHRFDQRVQNFEDKLDQGLTSDGFNLLASVYVGWRITDPKVFYPRFTGGTLEPVAAAQSLLQGRLSTAKMDILGKHPLADLLAPSGEGNRFVLIEKEILALVQADVQANNYGLKIEFLGLKKLGLPESVTQSVFERMQSERKVLADKLQSEGERDAQIIRSTADRQAAEMLADAEGQAIEILGKGEAEAGKYLEVFKKSPELANFIFCLAALENSLKDRSTLIFDEQTVPFGLFRGVTTNLFTR